MLLLRCWCKDIIAIAPLYDKQVSDCNTTQNSLSCTQSSNWLTCNTFKQQPFFFVYPVLVSIDEKDRYRPLTIASKHPAMTANANDWATTWQSLRKFAIDNHFAKCLGWKSDETKTHMHIAKRMHNYDDSTFRLDRKCSIKISLSIWTKQTRHANY